MPEQPDWIETDVLVLGAGGAGLQAALSAREAGAKVLLVSKNAADEPTCTTWTAGYFTYSTDESADELFRQIVTVGGHLNNQRLVEVLVEQLPRRMEALAALGLDMEVSRSDDPAMPGHWIIRKQGPERRGVRMVELMRTQAERRGVQVQHSTVCTKVERGPSGGWLVSALHLTTGKPLALAANAVVVATGGGAGAFARHDNAPGTTGDGIVMAFEAGAALVDLELVSFQFPRFRIADVFKLEAVPDPELLTKGTAHYFLGGVQIDDRAETCVPGLFAAGEATGGLFGAARIGGSAMADIIVFGAIAGENAAAYAASAKPPSPADAPRAARWRRSGNTAPSQLADRVRTELWRHLGTMKDAGTIEMARIGCCRAEAELDRCRVETPDDYRVWAEALVGVKLGQLLTAASERRPETRGCYWRVDYPDFDNETCLKSIVLTRGDAGVSVEERPIVTTRMTEPTTPLVGAGCFGYLPR